MHAFFEWCESMFPTFRVKKSHVDLTEMDSASTKEKISIDCALRNGDSPGGVR